MNPQKFYSSSLFPDPHVSNNNNKKRKYYSQAREEEMLAFGYECKIFDDKQIATHVDNERYLIPLKSSNASQVMMDRYDIRHLIQDETLLLKPIKREIAILDKEYDNDRYSDLQIKIEADFNESSRNKATIPYEYDNNKKVKLTTEYEQEIKQKYNTPDSMIVPATPEQLFVIQTISKEVGSVTTNSNLLEIRIQVKNASNSLYSFLNKQDVLYPFYKHLVSINTKSATFSSSLVAYSDSDSSSDDEENSIPLETRDRIEKIAKYIVNSSNSLGLEQHLLKMKGDQADYSFLNVGNIHHSYFKSKIKSLEKEKD